MWSFNALCDEFSVNTRLYLKLELEPSRETLLHFFDRIRRSIPTLTRLRRRDDDALVLDEEDGPAGVRRFVRVDATSLRFGCTQPADREQVLSLGRLILEQAPYHLSLSDLDYDYMDVIYTFDLEYRGNHDELVAETLFADHPLLAALTQQRETVIDCQPFLGIALDPTCDRQVYLDIKGRTSAFEVRTGEYEAQMLSVYVTARHYWGFREAAGLTDVFTELLTTGERYALSCGVPQVVQPLAAAIASRR